MTISGLDRYFSLSSQHLSKPHMKSVFMDLGILLFNKLFPEKDYTGLNEHSSFKTLAGVWKKFKDFPNGNPDPNILLSAGVYNLSCEDYFWGDILSSFDESDWELYIDVSTFMSGNFSRSDYITSEHSVPEPVCDGNCSHCPYMEQYSECDIYSVCACELATIQQTGHAHDNEIGNLIETAYESLLEKVTYNGEQVKEYLGEEAERLLSFDYLDRINECSSPDCSEAGYFAFPKAKEVLSFLSEHKEDSEWSYYYKLMECLLYGSFIEEEREIYCIDYWFYDDAFIITYTLLQEAEDTKSNVSLPTCIAMMYDVFEFVHNFLGQSVMEEEKKGA